MSLRWLTDPTTDLPSRAAKRVSETISPSNQVGSPMRGFLSGATEATGDLLSDMTSPLSLAGTAMGLGAAKSIGRGAQAVRRATRGVGPSRPILPRENPAEVAEMYNRYRRGPSPVRGQPNVPDNPVARILEAERRAAYTPAMDAPVAPSGGDLQQLLMSQRRAAAPRMMNPQVVNEAPVQQIMHPGQTEVNNMLQQLVGNLRRAPTGVSPSPEAQQALIRQLSRR